MRTPKPNRPIPSQALLISLLALAAPVISAFNAPGFLEGDLEVLTWLLVLIPAFLLTYYKGWRGGSVAVVLGMALLTFTQVALQWTGAPSPDWTLLASVVVVLVGVSLGLGYFNELLARERAAAEAQAFADALTGLPNRRHAEVFLDAAFASAIRGTPLTVVMFDLDFFKAINDSLGHAAGDDILKLFGELLGRATRRMDMAARYGGEEFLAILPECDLEAGQGYAERVLQTLRETELPRGRVTASAGVAAFEEGMGSPDLLVGAADQALYRAKANGRDRVEVWHSSETGGIGSGSRGVRKSGRGPRIVVVDDDPAVTDVLERVLGSLGYEARTFHQSRKALAHIEEGTEDVDLVLTDVVMPEMSGLTLAERVAECRPGVPVLLMSGNIQGEVKWAGIRGVGVGFLEKPMSATELKNAIEGILGGGPAQERETPVGAV